ncbi:MAG: TetR/AcrR family transcriptional regulator [Oscillospiraceae bacterium]|nr:TetR/AcrR family transcriptional regulator [Oscillospiraceae bacterium]
MNTPNNKRYRDMTECINAAFSSLLQNKELRDITVTDICEIAGIERSTFYAHYNDVAALANDYAAQIEKQVSEQPHKENDFSWIFEYIKEHPDFFKIYFKLGVSQVSSDYKTIFFRNGAYSVAKMWFEDGCVESSEQMGVIIKREYEKIFK